MQCHIGYTVGTFKFPYLLLTEVTRLLMVKACKANVIGTISVDLFLISFHDFVLNSESTNSIAAWTVSAIKVVVPSGAVTKCSFKHAPL